MSAPLRNQIPCTAERLSQLRPEMIQAVVPGAAYAVGHQYFSERRVRIVQADEMKIASEVAGARGFYQQTIRLADGTLMAKCSCPSSEAPICRHCVAVLLEYIRLSPSGEQGATAKKPAREPIVPQSKAPQEGAPAQDGPAQEPAAAMSVLGVRLREATIFLEWIQEAVTALKAGRSLPAAPSLSPGETLDWVQTLEALDAHARRGDEDLAVLRSELNAKDERLTGLTQDMESTNRQGKELKAICETLKLEVERGQATMSKLVGVEQERDRLADKIQDMTGDVIKRVAEIDRLAADMRKISGMREGLASSRDK